MNMKIKIELEPSAWNNLSMRDRAKYIHNSVLNHFVNGGSMTNISIDDIKHLFNNGEEKDIYAKANAILDERIKQKMMENRPSYEDWINNERNKVTQAAFEYSNQRTSPSYIMLDNPYKTEEEWTSAMNSIIAERQKELNDSIKLNANQPPMILQMNVSIAQLKLDDAIWEKNLGYSSKIPANSCLTTATDNYVQVTGDKSYGANLNSYFQNNHPGYEVVPGFEDAVLGDIVLLLEDNGEAKHGMIYAGLNDLGQYIFNNSAGGSEDIAYKKGISFRSINNDKNPNDHVLILRFIGNDLWNKDKEEDYNLRYPAFMLGGNLFLKGGPKEILEGNSPADLMRNDNIGFLQGYYPEVTIPKLSLYEAADNSGITLVPYLGEAVDAMQAANLAKEGKYAEAAILGSTLLIPNILEKSLKFLGTKALKYFKEGIETSEDLMKLSDDDWYSAYKTALHLDDKEGAKTILELRILTKKESGLEVIPFKTNLEKLYVLKPSFIRNDKTYKNLFWKWDLDRDYFYKKYRTTIGDLRKRYDNLKVQDGKRGQKLLEDINTNKTILKLEIELAVKEGKLPENFLEDLEFYTMDTYGRIPEYDSDKHLILAPWKNELKLTITTDPQTGQLIYDLLPIHPDSKYRYVGKDAYEDYVSRGIVSNIDDEGKALTRYSFPMFTSRNPSSYGFDNNKIWLVSKPDAPLEWESVKAAAITPVYKGETNKTPLSMFDIFLESSEGFRKLLGFGGTLFDKGGPTDDEKKTLFEPIEHPVIPKVPSDQDTMDWLAYWYNNRRKQLYNNRIQARKDLLVYSSIPSSISDLINNYEIGRTELNKLYYRKLNSLAYPVTVPVPEEEYYTPRFYGNTGVNKGDTIFINYNHVTPNSKQELETKVHERVHSLLDPYYFRGFNELTDIINDILVPKETPSSEYDKYLNDGREGYPRLMEFRRIHNIDPNKVWNVEEVKQLLELDEKNKEEHHLYKWTPESVTKALNEVAYRNQNNVIIQAANGGTLLHLFNNGGYLFAKGGPKDELTLADGKVNYSYFLHPIDAFRYNGSPSYNTDIPFATAFTDAIRNNLETFQWGDNIYNTDIDWKHHFSKDENGNSPFKEFAEIMYPAVIKVLLELGLPITNAHNIVRQAAIESKYGTDPRGALGYNLSGIKWTKSADPKYKHTTGADGEEYIDFDNLKDYIYYKVKILNDNYNALNAKNAKDFARRLHPNAAGIPTNLRASGYKGDYSGDYNSYKNNITNLNSLDKTLFHQMYKPLFGK